MKYVIAMIFALPLFVGTASAEYPEVFCLPLFPVQVPQPDADADGIPDYFDHCPNTPIGDESDWYGCGYTEVPCDPTMVCD